MKKKLELVVGVLIGIMGTAQAAVITSATDGSWETGATWAGGTAPGVAGDTARVLHNVTLQSAVTISNFTVAGTAKTLTLNNGATLTADTGNNAVGAVGANAAMIINSGAKLDTGSRNMTIGWRAATASMVVNGGTFTNTTAGVKLGFSSVGGTNAYTTLVVTNGGVFHTSGALQFNAITNSITQVSVYKDSFLTAANLDFFGSVNATNSLTVAGGTLTLIVGNESLAMDSDTKLYFDSGKIVITGVDTQNDFNTFTNNWNTWVDNGNITSTQGYTKDEIKSALTFDGTDAVATIRPLGLIIVGAL